MASGIYVRTLEHRAKMRIIVQGRKHTPETRAKMSADRMGQGTGRKLLPETRVQIAASLRGHTNSPTARAKMRASHVGVKLSSKHRANISAGLQGHATTAESRTKMSATHRARYAENPGPLLDALVKAKMVQGPTRLERALYRLLDGAGLEFECERRFGNYRVDVYIPSHNLVFEADGPWGHNPRKDAARDRYLVRGGVAAVIRLVGQDLQPFMEKN